MCILIGMLEPFTKRSDYNLALINEWFCLMLNYHLFAFTDWVTDGFARECMGYSMIALTLSIIDSLGSHFKIRLMSFDRLLHRDKKAATPRKSSLQPSQHEKLHEDEGLEHYSVNMRFVCGVAGVEA